ncbi:MAG: signal peptidase II [Bacteroidota bacterium]
MRVLWVSFAILVVDQLTKLWIHTSMFTGESIPLVGDVLKLTYTTNPGMAFGLELGSKLFLTLFSIAATVLIVIYLWVVRKGPWGYRLSLALIIGGAFGNIIDRVFYGVLGITGGGTGRLFHGEVVDFIHVDLWRGFLPEWIPFFGGNFLALFPIWNVADMAIVVGVAAIIVFQRRFHEGLVRAAEAEKAEAEKAEAPLADPAVPAAAEPVTLDAPPVAEPSAVEEPAAPKTAPPEA